MSRSVGRVSFVDDDGNDWCCNRANHYAFSDNTEEAVLLFIRICAKRSHSDVND